MDITLLKLSINAIISSDERTITKLSNLSAAIYQSIEKINWAGFYILDKENKNLYLGPFQGKIACSNININEGVCGKAVRDDTIQRVADVHKFEGHIACDSNTKSEIVLPLRKNGKIWAVLDIDSPFIDRFSENDEKILKEISEIIGEKIDIDKLI